MARYESFSPSRKKSPKNQQHSARDLKLLYHELLKKVDSEKRNTRKKLAQRFWGLRKKHNARILFRQQRLKEETAQALKLAIPQISHELRYTIEKECIQLSLKVAEKFLSKILTKDKKYLANLIQEEIKKTSNSQTSYTLRFHPSDKRELSKLFTPLTQNSLKHEIDENITPGTANIQSTDGTIHLDWKDDYASITRELMSEHLSQYLAAEEL